MAWVSLPTVEASARRPSTDFGRRPFRLPCMNYCGRPPIPSRPERPRLRPVALSKRECAAKARWSAVGMARGWSYGGLQFGDFDDSDGLAKMNHAFVVRPCMAQ